MKGSNIQISVSALFIILGLLFSSAIGATEDAIASELAVLIEEGWHSNQELAGLEERIAALRESAVSAGSLDNLKLGIAMLNLPTDTFSTNQEAMTQKQLSLAQRIPWFGTLDLKSKRVLLQAVSQESILDAKRNELSRNISEAYWELAFIDRSLEVNRRLTQLVGQLLRVAEARYAAGKGLQQDVLQGQVEQSKLLDEALTLDKRRQVIERRINALINRPAFQQVVPSMNAQMPAIPKLDSAALKTQVISNNPRIISRRVEIEQAEVNIALAEKSYYPDFNVLMAYGQRDDDPRGRERADFVSAGVQLSIPLWFKKKQDRNLSAAKRNREAARRAYANLTESIPYQADAVAEEMRTLIQNYRLYNDALVAQASQWAHSALVAYEVGKVEFSTMIDAQMRLLRAELQQDNYRFALLRKHAEFIELLGGNRPSSLSQKAVDEDELTLEKATPPTGPPSDRETNS